MRVRHRRHRLRRGVGIVLVHVDDAAGDVAPAVAVEEVDDEPDASPDRKHQLRLQRQREIEADAADYRERRDDPDRRGAERTMAVRIGLAQRSEEHTSELPSLMRISYAVFYLTKKQHE